MIDSDAIEWKARAQAAEDALAKIDLIERNAVGFPDNAPNRAYAYSKALGEIRAALIVAGHAKVTIEFDASIAKRAREQK